MINYYYYYHCRYSCLGTKLGIRISCKAHDIAYSQSNSLNDRHKADSILEIKEWKGAAWPVTSTTRAKRKKVMGMHREDILSFRQRILLTIEKNLQMSTEDNVLNNTKKDVRN